MNQAASVIPPQLLAALVRLRLNPRSRRTARGRGERLAGRGGASTDLADWRDYVEGDDLRAVDWNVFARLQRPYLRLYRLEEDRHLVVLVDASASMAEGGKLARAGELAAALGAVGLASGDRVSLWCFGGENDPRRLPPMRGLAVLPRWLAACAALAPATGEGRTLTPPAQVARMLARHVGRGACLLISDFTHDGEPEPALTRLHAAGLEPLAIQVLAQAELDPDPGADARFVDAETGAELDVALASGALGLYADQLAHLRRRLAGACAARGGRFAAASVDEPLPALLTDRLRRQGWFA